MDKQDKVLAAAVTVRVEAARTRLAAWMSANGLRERDGWRVSEELRSTANGTAFVFRPIHSRLDAPDHQEAVFIDSDGLPV